MTCSGGRVSAWTYKYGTLPSTRPEAVRRLHVVVVHLIRQVWRKEAVADSLVYTLNTVLPACLRRDSTVGVEILPEREIAAVFLCSGKLLCGTVATCRVPANSGSVVVTPPSSLHFSLEVATSSGSGDIRHPRVNVIGSSTIESMINPCLNRLSSVSNEQ